MEDLSEKEQLEQMRAWWSEYGNFVVAGVVVGLAIIVGVNQFSAWKVRTQMGVSEVYEQVVAALGDGDLDEAEAAADTLFTDYERTVYPSQARLALARLYMDRGRDQEAADALRAVVDKESNSELGLVARLRLAKVLLYQDQAEQVIDLLANLEESSFSARFAEALGDAYIAEGRFDDAREAYQRALNDTAEQPTVDRQLVQMKIDDLPPADAAAVSTTVESGDMADMAADSGAGEEQ